MSPMTHLEDVRASWGTNPLYTDSSSFESHSISFLEERRNDCLTDCFAASLNLRPLPPSRTADQELRVLDLGRGIVVWLSEFAMRGLLNLVAADLTGQALRIAAKRLEAYGLKAEPSKQNAEAMTFQEHTLDHVNSQGVIHHAPATDATMKKIARARKPGGTESISIYYRKSTFSHWSYLRGVNCLRESVGALGADRKSVV